MSVLRIKTEQNKTKTHLTFTDGQVVGPLSFAFLDAAVYLVAAHQLVALPAPEGQHATDRHASATLHVEGTPAWWQDRDTGQTWGEDKRTGCSFRAQMFTFSFYWSHVSADSPLKNKQIP